MNDYTTVDSSEAARMLEEVRKINRETAEELEKIASESNSEVLKKAAKEDIARSYKL